MGVYTEIAAHQYIVSYCHSLLSHHDFSTGYDLGLDCILEGISNFPQFPSRSSIYWGRGMLFQVRRQMQGRGFLDADVLSLPSV
mgnify:CR=1 FL=1